MVYTLVTVSHPVSTFNAHQALGARIGLAQRRNEHQKVPHQCNDAAEMPQM